MSTSPTQLSLRQLRKEGWSLVEVVEHWNAFTKRRNDLFGMFDILGVAPGQTIAVQTTSHTNVSARVKKIREHPNLIPVLESGWILEVHGWRKNKSGRWELSRRVEILEAVSPVI